MLAAATAVLVHALPAQAAEVHGDNGPLGLILTASAGEINDVQVSYSAGSYTIRDSGSTLSAGAFCVSIGPNEVRCTNTSSFAWHNVDFRLGDEDDRATILSIDEADVVHFRVFGEAGNDVATSRAKWGGMMWGGEGNDSLEIDAFAGNATFIGEAGDDYFRGGNYLDDFNGGEGDDTFVPGAYDRAMGGPGSDTLDFSASGVGWSVDLAAGTVSGFGPTIDATFENVLGGSGDDVLRGNAGANRLDGGGGDDLLDGRFGPDDLVGSEGFDIVDYSDRADGVLIIPGLTTISGNDDDGLPIARDWVHQDVEGAFGGDGDDVFIGNAADNLFNGGYGADEFTGFGGFDLVDYSDRTTNVTVMLTGGANSGNADDGPDGGRDLIAADVEDIVSGSGDDTLVGNGLDNFFDGGFGADSIDGGPGDDLVDYSSRSVAVNVVLNGGPNSGNDEDGPLLARDTLVSIEDALGGDGGDALFGSAGPNVLLSGAGDDLVQGNGGEDLLGGGSGRDRLAALDGAVDTVLCGDDDDTAYVERADVVAMDCETIEQGGPTATLGETRDVTRSSATLTASVHPNRAPTIVYFELGTTTAYGTKSSPVGLEPGNEDVTVNAKVTGLAAGTTYHFRVVAQNSVGATYSSDGMFTTAAEQVVPPPPPPPARCVVPNVKGKTLTAGRRALARRNCRVGKVRRLYSRTVRKGRILSQSRRPGARLPKGTKVAMVVSRGKKPRTRPRRG